MWFLSRCVSICTAETPSRQWAYFGGLRYSVTKKYYRVGKFLKKEQH
jgi:hypothetical protein